MVYLWVRSDGSVSPEKTMHFSKSGPLPVSYTWAVTGKVHGWLALRMLSPTRVETHHVSFAIGTCP